jgi:hypothetical protein
VSSTTLADATYNVVASATDVAGNTASDTQAIVIDTAAPGTPTVDTQETTNPQPVITGTLPAPDVQGGVLVSIDGKTYILGVHPALSVTGNVWTLNLVDAGHVLTAKTYEVTIAVRDLAGNGRFDLSSNEVTILPVQPPVVDSPIPAEPQVSRPDQGTSVVTEIVQRAPDFGSGVQIRLTDDSRDLQNGRIGDHLTANGENAFRIAVARADEPSLSRFFGVPDQNFDVGARVRFQLPADAFLHTKENAVVRLIAEQVQGSSVTVLGLVGDAAVSGEGVPTRLDEDVQVGPLPSWLTFNATAGVFEGVAPPGAPQEIAIRVTARDDEGREASTIFRIKLTAGQRISILSRDSFEEQVKQLAGRPVHLDKLAHFDKLAKRSQARS